VITVSVCVSLCVFVCLSASISLEIHVRPLPYFVRVTAMAVARSSGGVAIRYVLPVLTYDVILARKPRQLNVAALLMEAQPTCSLGLGYKRRVGIPVAGQWTHTHGSTFLAPTRPLWAC